MDAQARATIEFSDSGLRYAEVEQYGSRFRLLRLGTCDFDFDPAEDLLRNQDSGAVSIVREALLDVFSGSLASVLHVVVHPQDITGFFTSLGPGLEESDRLRRFATEAMLLTGADTPSDLSISSSELGIRRDSGEMAYSVLATPASLRHTLDSLMVDVAQQSYGLKLSTSGAAAIMIQLWQRKGAENDSRRPLSLAVGSFGSAAEFAVTRRGEWWFSHHAHAKTAPDLAFYAAGLLEEIGARGSEIGAIYLYGDTLPGDAVAVFQSLWDVRVEKLNPLVVVDVDPDTLAGNFASEAYAPCVGAAL